MKSYLKVTALIALSGVALWRCGNNGDNSEKATAAGGSPTALRALPTDVMDSCSITADSFNTWFASGHVTENGVVNPANSVTFAHANNCDFYQWSEQMFLWITSPASGAYGQGGLVLQSPVFFGVSPEDSAGHRYLIPPAPNTPFRMTADLQKNGPNRLPVIKDKKGRLLEIETPKHSAQMLVQSSAGASVTVDHVESDNKGGFLFMNKAGKVIEHPKALIQHKRNQDRIVQRFAVGKKFIFLDNAGNIIESEAGQATGDVLRATNGSLVYYLSFVNDVYAYFLTATREGYMANGQFPTTAGARDSICAFARAHGVTLPDSNALAIELKTSWVEAADLSHPENYVIVNATIPVYDTSNPTQWVPISEKTVPMALVGMHVVGSVAGHPEMIWATFEHENNTPNAAYQYLDKSGNVKIAPQDQGTNWLFSTNAADASPNVSHMQNAGDTINAVTGDSITQSNVLQLLPWGSAMDSLTNQQDGSSAASNSEILSINNAIRNLLAGNDVRKRYLLIGATWTFGGAAPLGISYGSDTTPGVSIGTNVLANSTMETYFQSASNSCFTCHSSGVPSVVPDSLSHIYSRLQPLMEIFNRAKQAEKK